MALEPEDRTEELIQQTRESSGVQLAARPRKKDRGDCRMVVEIPFYFTKEFLDARGKANGTYYTDAVDYLRVLKEQFENHQLSLADLIQMMITHGDGALRVEAAK